MIHPGVGPKVQAGARNTRSWMQYYLLALLISLSNALPLLHSSKLDQRNLPTSTISYLIVCYLLSLPLLFEFVMDVSVSYFSFTPKQLREPQFGYFLILISLFGPVLCVRGSFVNASSPYKVTEVNCFLSFLQTLVIIGQYGKLQFRSHGHWTMSGCLATIFLYTASQTSLNFGIAYSSRDLVSLTPSQVWCYSISVTFSLLCCAQHFYLVKKYFFPLFTCVFRGDSSESQQWKVDDCVTIVLQRIIFIAFVVQLFGSLHFLVGKYDFMNHLNCAAVTHIVLGLCAAILPGRVVRKNFILLNESMAIKETFIRYVSHEIRSPLSTTSLGLNYLLDKLRAHEINLSEVLDVVQESVVTCELAMNTLNDFLMLDKIQSNMLEISPVARQASEFMVEAVRPFSLQSKSENLNLFCNVESFNGITGRNVIVEMDTYKMNQVLRNLLSNALKFTPSGGTITATMTVHEYTEDALTKVKWANDLTLRHLVNGVCHMVKFEVTDSGCGISAENLPRLFGQYVQFDAAKLQGGKGSGLGLWLSKAIVEMHGGRIGARSEGEGKGCTFWFELPCTVNDDEDQSQSFSMASSFVSRNFSMSCSSALPGVPRVDTKDSYFLSDIEEGIIVAKASNLHLPAEPFKSAERLVPPRRPSVEPPSKLIQAKNSAVTSTVTTDKKFVDLEIERSISLRVAAKYKQSPSCCKKISSPSAVGSTGVSEPQPARLKVLLVDDSNIARKMVERSLASIDAVCTHARTGCEAVEKVREAMTIGVHYDVILMDHFMPEMSGPEAVEVIRDRLQYKGVIMGVSGNGSADAEFESLLAEDKINVIMGKPFSLDLFINFLEV